MEQRIVDSQVLPASIYPMELLAEMYQLESPEQKAARLKRLAEYDASKHIAEWEKWDKNGGPDKKGVWVLIRYYPASWRLFELHLRYPYANFSSEMVVLDKETDTVVVKCCLYLGPSYELSPKKAEAYKQGRLSILDKIETAAKARCARDFGIGTEHALDIEDGEIQDYTPGTEPKETKSSRQSQVHGAPQPQKRETARVQQPAGSAPQLHKNVPQHSTPRQESKETTNSQQSPTGSTSQSHKQETVSSKQSATSAPNEKASVDLSKIPTVPTLRQQVKSLGLEWSAVLGAAFKTGIDKGKYTVATLEGKGDELPPMFCQHLEQYLKGLEKPAA